MTLWLYFVFLHFFQAIIKVKTTYNVQLARPEQVVNGFVLDNLGYNNSVVHFSGWLRSESTKKAIAEVFQRRAASRRPLDFPAATADDKLNSEDEEEDEEDVNALRKTTLSQASQSSGKGKTRASPYLLPLDKGKKLSKRQPKEVRQQQQQAKETDEDEDEDE